jgi:pilus assembly protein CpaB
MRRSSVTQGASRFGALGFLAVALGCAAVAAFAIGNLMKSSYSGVRVAPVVVARDELRAGQPLAAEALEVRNWPEDAVPQGSFASVEELLAAAKGSTPTVGILPGEPVVPGRLSSSHAGTGVAQLLQPKLRAFAIAVDPAAGYTGLLYPGAFVDIVATMRDPMGRGPSSKIAVQHARVLTVGMDTDVATRRVERGSDGLEKTADRGTFVTLEVTPADAEILAMYRSEGRIDIVLRNATDDAVVETTGATAFALEPAPAEEPVAAQPEPTPTVKREKRRMQFVASDAPDTTAKPKTRSGSIEVLNAK